MYERKYLGRGLSPEDLCTVTERFNITGPRKRSNEPRTDIFVSASFHAGLDLNCAYADPTKDLDEIWSMVYGPIEQLGHLEFIKQRNVEDKWTLFARARNLIGSYPINDYTTEEVIAFLGKCKE
jgi:hypothetical protein